jgi:hypothetical protein
MPESDHAQLMRALPEVDDAAAAAMASPETHAELLQGILAAGYPDAERGGRRHRSAPSWSRRPVLLATALAAIVAVLLIVTPGLLSGGSSATQPQSAQAQILHRIAAALARKPGTILIQKLTLRSSSTARGTTNQAPLNTLTTITETPANISNQQVFFSSSLAPGYQQANGPDTMELYDPATSTIYATTQADWLRDTDGQAQGATTTGAELNAGLMYVAASGEAGAHTNIFEEQLQRHLFKIAGRTTVDGRTALKLVRSRGAFIMMNPDSGAFQDVSTVYVSPRSYALIREVATTTGGVTVIANWSLYKALADTAANARMLSLRARHPQARVVHGAAAFVAAENQPTKAGSVNR